MKSIIYKRLMHDIYQRYQHQTCEYYTEGDLYKYHSILH